MEGARRRITTHPSAAAIKNVPNSADNHQGDNDDRAYSERHSSSAVRRRGR
jgi:hypothetical protein